MINLRTRKYYFIILLLSSLAFFMIHRGVVLLNDSVSDQKLKELNYTDTSIKLIKEKKIANYIIEKNLYSKTLEVALIDGLFIKEHLDEYVHFEYKDYDKYIYHLNNLLSIGYRKDEVNIILQNLVPEEIDIIISKEIFINNLPNYIVDTYFNINNLDRYLSYKSKNINYSYEKTISHVNMNLDYDFYQKITNTKNPDSTLVIVNKYYKLENTFVPKGLTKLVSDCSTSSQITVIPIVKKAFEEMCMDIKSIGLTIKAISGYRSYYDQDRIYNNYVLRDGAEKANTYSAKPGHSEHQTGLAIDVYNTVISFSNFDKTVEYVWIKGNAHRYGFIVRYPDSKDYITGYKYEPWHLRYVGEEVATYIYNNKITFDEYYSKFLNN